MKRGVSKSEKIKPGIPENKPETRLTRKSGLPGFFENSKPENRLTRTLFGSYKFFSISLFSGSPVFQVAQFSSNPRFGYPVIGFLSPGYPKKKTDTP